MNFYVFIYLYFVSFNYFTVLKPLLRNNETNVVLQDVGTFYWQISAFKCNFGPIGGL